MCETLLDSLGSVRSRGDKQIGSSLRKRRDCEKDIEESERLRRILVTQFQKNDDGLVLRISQEEKTLFIRGSMRMTDYNSNKAPWENYKETIRSEVISEGVESIRRCALS